MGPTERARKYLQELVAIESPTGNEDPVIDYLQKNLPLKLEEYKRCVFFVPPKAQVLLIGHTDTVPLASDQRQGIEGEWFYGRGAVDMKGGLSLICEAAHRLPKGVGIIFYDREEGPFPNGLTDLLDGRPDIFAGVKLALLLEPTNAGLELGCKGSLHATATLQGVSAHSARPHLGQNPLQYLPALMDRVQRATCGVVNVDGIDYRETVSITQVTMAQARNMIPDKLVANINYRFAPGKSEEQAINWMESLLKGLPSTTWTVADAVAGARPFANHGFVQWARTQGFPVESKEGWTDVAQVASRLQIPAFNFGPGDPKRCHQVDEKISWAELALAQDRLQLILDNFANLV